MNNSQKNIAITIFIIISVLFFLKFERASQEVSSLSDNNFALKMGLSDCTNKLNQAASTIDNLNSSIDDARNQAWGTYEDMGDALDNLSNSY